MLKSFRGVILLSVFTIFILISCQKIPSQSQQVININGIELKVEIAVSSQEITQGLSSRKNLCQNCGLLFKFPDYQIRDFWMKDMNFPLDVIWVKDDTIVGIESRVPVFTNGEISMVQSKEKVNRVLEVNSGWVESHNVKKGDKVRFD